MAAISEITFDNGNRASVVMGDSGSGFDPGRTLSELGLTAAAGRPVIVVFGGASNLSGAGEQRATAVIGPGIARAAQAVGAAIVDGGTAAGVMSIVGEAVAERDGDRLPLVGVAPRDLVSLPGSPAPDRTPLEPNHSHFVLVPGSEWGAETEPLLRVAEALAAGSNVVAVLIGGGDIAKAEALAAVRHGWTLVVVEGTGGTADSVARGRRVLRKSTGHGDDPQLDEIAKADSIRLFAGDDGARFSRELAWELQNESTLKDAWHTFAGYDALAKRARMTFSRVQASILILAIGGTFLALLEDAGEPSGVLGDVVHWTVVATPIAASILIALAVRLGFGKRWVLLRGAAEAIKSEIFRFRTRTGVYGPKALADAGLDHDEVLATRLNAIDQRLMTTEASGWPLTPYDGPLPPEMYGASKTDDGLSPLDADRYLVLRIGDQLDYYHPKVVGLARQLRALQVLALAVGAVGTLLAAAGLEVWIGLTTVIAASAVAYLGYLQVEPTLVAYNQAAGRLENLRRSWNASPPEHRDFERLVGESEGVLMTELSGWVQQMNEAVEEAAKGADGRADGGAASREEGSD